MNKEKVRTVVFWGIQILIALVFLLAGGLKLASHPNEVEAFRNWGYPDKFYLLVGAVEVLGAIGLLITRLTGYAAILLFGNMIGAIITHLTHNQANRLFLPVLLLILLGIVAYTERPDFLRKKLVGSSPPEPSP